MRYQRLISAVALAGVLVGGCSSGPDKGEGVASLGGDKAATGVESSEEKLLSYVKCLREQGLDVPDPEVDAEGQLAVKPGGSASADPAQRHAFRAKYEAAQKVCGSPPPGMLGASTSQDASALHDALLSFAKCMRAEGVDVPDPDPSGAGNAPSMLSGLDMNDQKVKAARDQCGKAFAEARTSR